MHANVPLGRVAGIAAGVVDGSEEFDPARVRYCAATTDAAVLGRSQLEFIDGSGLRGVVAIERRLRPLGRRLVLRGFPASCRPAIERAGLGNQLRREDGRAGPDAASGDGTLRPSRRV